MIGPKTEIVVSVAAVIAACTSSAPFAAASIIPIPACRCRKMFSSTMIELSTSIPTPSASPPRLMMLSDTPNASMRANVPITEMGIASAMATG